MSAGPSHFRTVGVIAKQGDTRLVDTLGSLLDHLAGHRLHILLDESARGLLPTPGHDLVDREVIAQQADLAIIVGGDGTLLNAARSLTPANVPLLGVNLGRLGFLVDVSPDEMASRLDEILAGQYVEDQRTLLATEVIRAGHTIARREAFNDVVLRIREVVRMIEFETFIGGRFVNTQRADGMVVATPTGSTAYALSGGGPILHPSLDALVLVPICPHTLSHRPIVVDADSRIEIAVCRQNPSQVQVSFDGQANVDLQPEDRVVIGRQAQRARLLHPTSYDYFHILRAKLRWSEQP